MRHKHKIGVALGVIAIIVAVALGWQELEIAGGIFFGWNLLWYLLIGDNE